MNMFDLISTQFHFLRPLWLIAIVPAMIMAILLWRQKRNAQQWQQMIAPELLRYLLDGQTTRIKPWQFLIILCAWIVACVALAGPSWQKRPMPVEKNEQALVLILDLSPSMLSEDIKPSRLVRARLKITDILRARKDGQTALVAYAGDVHAVSPLTDDMETINNIVPALHPNIMPVQGSNTEEAVARAIQLLKDAGIPQGDLLLITDGIDESAQARIIQTMANERKYRLSILGVGGDTPTPIPGGKGGFVRDRSGNIVTTQLNSGELQTLASSTQGRYRTLANTSADIDYLLTIPAPLKDETQRVERNFDSWYDQGYWLVFLLLPIILYCFRRGVLLLVFCIPLAGLAPQKSYAFGWSDLWKNNNQQAYERLQNNDSKAAAEQFRDEEWKATAEYRAGDYDAAAKHFAKKDTAQAHYNRGNALAKSGQLEDALKAYDEALKRDPQLADAKQNRKLTEELLKQQKEQQQKNQQQDNKDQQESDEQKQQQSSDQSKQDQQNQQQDQSQQQGDQQQNNQDQQQQQDQQQDQQDQQNKEQTGQNSSQDNQQQQEGQQQDETSSAASAAEKEAEQKKDEQQAEQETTQQAAEENPAAEPAGSEAPDDGMTDEERQAVEQWLRRVPDDPGGLLRNKFRYQYQKNRQDMSNGDFKAPANDADRRW